MPPPFVTDLHGYWSWVEDALAATGGYFDHGPYLRVEVLVDKSGEAIGLSIPQQRLHLHDRTFLEFDLTVDDELVPLEYSFHFQVTDGPMIWRKDFHLGHGNELGADTHIHDDPNDPDERRLYELVEVDEVVGQMIGEQ